MSEGNSGGEYLNRRIADLERQLAESNAESKKRRIELKKLRTEHQEALELVTELDSAVKGHEESAATAPGEWQQKYEQAAAQLRSRDHRDAFAGVREFEGPEGKKYTLHDRATHEKVWAEIGYTAEGDAPDGDAVKGHLGRALLAAPYLFREKTVETTTDAPGGAQRPIATPRREAGPGAGRSTQDPTPPSILSVIQDGYSKTGRTIPGKL